MRHLFSLWLEWASEDQRDGGCPLLGASTELTIGPASSATTSSKSKKPGSTASRESRPKRSLEQEFRADLDVEQFAFEFNNIGLGFNFAHRLLDDTRARQRAKSAFETLVASATR